jgi:drug/metabolite transporter (DMT)-like permease
MLQKRVQQPPAAVLPLQYLVTRALYMLVLPTQPFQFEPSIGFWVPLLFLGLVISVAAQLLLYRMIRSGNLVNVTSLFYLVSVVTVVLDHLVLGHTMPPLAMVAMVAILAGLLAVFTKHDR